MSFSSELKELWFLCLTQHIYSWMTEPCLYSLESSDADQTNSPSKSYNDRTSHGNNDSGMFPSVLTRLKDKEKQIWLRQKEETQVLLGRDGIFKATE